MSADVHHVHVDHEHSGFCRFRARCSCGWSSDSYAQASDADRALVIHLRRADRLRDREALYTRVLDYPVSKRSRRTAQRRARLRG